MPEPHPITGETSRPTRPCAGCDVVDDGPRCVGSAVNGATPPPVWHHGCHALVGCPVCIAINKASGGAKDDELLECKVALQQPDGPWLIVDGDPVHAHPH